MLHGKRGDRTRIFLNKQVAFVGKISFCEEKTILGTMKVVIIDDLIATGGTTEAIIKLVEREGGEVVKIGFVMELEGLKGRERLKDYDVFSLISYPGN